MNRIFLRLVGRVSLALLAPACFLLVPVRVLPAPLPQAPSADDLIAGGSRANAAGQYNLAIKQFKQANKLRHNACFACYVGLASAYSGLEDEPSAEENAGKALAVAADDRQRSEAHTLKGSLLLRFFADDSKKLAAAETEFRQAIAGDAQAAAPHFQLGCLLMKEKRDDQGAAELNVYLALAPDGPFADRAHEYLADPRHARERFAPDFEANTLQGDSIALHQFSGKFVVLDFWATWCPPCRASVPELKSLLKKYPRDKLVLISISADSDENAWRDFISKKNMDWPQVLDADGHLARSFGVRAFPTYMVIDAEGVIQKEIVGLNEQESVAYRLRDALKSFKQLN